MSEVKVLIVYYSKHGNTAKMAKLIARGVESIENTTALIRTVASFGEEISDCSDPIVSHQDLKECSGLILGSPSRFGNMAAEMKKFIDETGTQWFSGTLVDKPAAVFTSSSSIHGGQETTLLTMMLPLLHHGMIVVGLPYTEKALLATESGGTPYGPSHWSGLDSNRIIDKHEKSLCIAMGKRIATIAINQQRIS
jgi:NAD(P)H dehydrogenase (quinone)